MPTPVWFCALCVALVATACAGSTTPDADAPRVDADPKAAAEARAREAARKEILAQEPKAPYGDATRRAFRAPAGCGQGPYRFEFTALGARFGEQFSLYVCSPRDFRGDYRIVQEGSTGQSEVRSFGDEHASNRCVATEVEVAQRGGGSSTGGASSTTPKNRPTAPAPAGTSTRVVTTTELAEVAAHFDSCPEGTRRVDLIGHSFASYQDVPLPKGRKFTVELWSAVPHDLTSVVFVVSQQGVRDGTTPEAWRDYLDKSHAWIERYRAWVQADVDAGHSHWVDTSAKASTPPPAARAESRPPKPSQNAEWVAGYWHHETDWAWMGGFWRVPQADVDAELTTHAPTPPPAQDKDERPAPRPSRRAVWTPGYWQWDGGTYVWIDGAWRIPPREGQTWTRPRWRSGRARSGVVFVPGGWSVSIGR